MRSCDGSTGIPEARLCRPSLAAASGTWQREASTVLDASRCPYLKTVRLSSEKRTGSLSSIALPREQSHIHFRCTLNDLGITHWIWMNPWALRSVWQFRKRRKGSGLWTDDTVLA